MCVVVEVTTCTRRSGTPFANGLEEMHTPRLASASRKPSPHQNRRQNIRAGIYLSLSLLSGDQEHRKAAFSVEVSSIQAHRRDQGDPPRLCSPARTRAQKYWEKMKAQTDLRSQSRGKQQCVPIITQRTCALLASYQGATHHFLMGNTKSPPPPRLSRARCVPATLAIRSTSPHRILIANTVARLPASTGTDLAPAKLPPRPRLSRALPASFVRHYRPCLGCSREDRLAMLRGCRRGTHP